MKTTISIITALALVSAVNAQEKQPGSQEAQNLMKQAGEAKQAGRYDEAKALYEKAQQIAGAQKDGKGQKTDKGPPVEKKHHEAPDGKGPDDKMAKVRHQIEEMHRAGKHEEAEQLQRRVAESMQHKKGAPDKHGKGPQKEGEGPARLRHVVEAIKHLREAGLNEPAEGLEKIARELHQQFEHREHADKVRKPEPGPKGEAPHKGDKPHPKGEPPHKGDKPHPPGGELQAMREQMEKMARAIEELRAQNKGQGDEEVRKPRKE